MQYVKKIAGAAFVALILWGLVDVVLTEPNGLELVTYALLGLFTLLMFGWLSARGRARK